MINNPTDDTDICDVTASFCNHCTGELCIICMRYDENVNQNILNDGDCLGHGTALRGPDQVAMGISE